MIPKFKAWNKERKEMYDVDAIDFFSGVIEVDNEYDHQTENIENYELIQFTGLTDKNGREIYKKYIIRVENFRFSTSHQATELIREVSFKHGTYVLTKKGMLDIPMSAVSTKNIEVIGNVFQDKHLLKE